MKFLEQDLEDIIFNADQEELRKRGLPLDEKAYLFRQFNLGQYGRADLVTAKKIYDDNVDFEITVFELKKDKLNLFTLAQAGRYLKAIKHILADRSIDAEYRIVLIGRELDDEFDFNLIWNELGSVVYTYTYDFDGIKFHPMCQKVIPAPNFNNIYESKKYLR